MFTVPNGEWIKKEFIEEIKLNPAGTASGSLINAAKLGLNCLSVASVGSDEKGDFIEMSVSLTRELNFGGSRDPKSIQKASKNELKNQPIF